MPSLRAHGSAVPSTTDVSHRLDGSQDTEILSSIEIKRAVREFLMEFSSLDKLTSCSSIYLTEQKTWNRCEHQLCWSCARKRAADLTADLATKAAQYPTLITVTLSLRTMPSTTLSDAWDALDDVRGALTAGRWLTSRVAAYRWHTEITKGDTWHPHSALLLASRFGPQDIKAEVLDRWADAAAKRGHEALADAAAAQEITRTRRRALGYLVKGPVALHADSRTAGRILLDAALHDDAEAAADWIEIENASAGRRWQGTGGEFRARRTIVVQEPEHDLFALLDVEIATAPPRPSLGPQVPSEHRRLTVGEERALEARERREQSAREDRMRAEFEAERLRELAEHEERLARFATYRNAPSSLPDDPSLLALIDG